MENAFIFETCFQRLNSVWNLQKSDTIEKGQNSKKKRDQFYNGRKWNYWSLNTLR